MILPSEIADLQKLEDAEDMEQVSVPSCHCSRCHELITADSNPATPTLCRACAEKQTHTVSTVRVVSEEPKSVSTLEAAALRVDFNHAIEHLLQALHSLNVVPNETLDRQLIDLWKDIAQLSRFLEASAEHLELIAALGKLAHNQPTNRLSGPKADGLLDAFQLVRGKFILSETILNEVYRILDRAGFDASGTIKTTSA